MMQEIEIQMQESLCKMRYEFVTILIGMSSNVQYTSTWVNRELDHQRHYCACSLSSYPVILSALLFATQLIWGSGLEVSQRKEKQQQNIPANKMAGNLAKIGKVFGQLSTTSTKACAPAVASQNRNCKYFLVKYQSLSNVSTVGRRNVGLYHWHR